MTSDERRRIVETGDRGDIDELVRQVDGICAAREWEGVVLLRDRCRHALEERGLQLWPAAEYAEYRLALEAPGPYAGAVVVEGAGRFALGPLWEVAASSHGWNELAEHVPEGPARAMTTHERVVRGEELGADPLLDSTVLELPFRLEPWEPRYPPAIYRADTADFPTPSRPGFAPLSLGSPGEPVDDEESLDALRDLGRVWAEQSNGTLQVAAVDGGIESAIAALTDGDVSAAEIDGTTAMAWMAWAGASGGAYGRRRGTPAGRFAAWWAAATLAGLSWPVEPEELGRAIGEMRWVLWQPAGEQAGWRLHIAAASDREGMAWAISAVDSHREDDPLAADRPGPFADG